jgi:hypothetical protein
MTATVRKPRPLALSLIAVGAVARLIPHPPNFTPVGAMSLYAGARLSFWQAYLMPLVVLAVTDPILGRILGFPAFTALTPFVYLSFVLNVWIGRRLRHSERIWQIAGAASLGSLQFFLVTNFAEWAAGRLYPHTVVGLVDCYVLAIPFFAWTLAGDLTYAAVFFGLHAWLSRRYFPRELVKVGPMVASSS